MTSRIQLRLDAAAALSDNLREVRTGSVTIAQNRGRTGFKTWLARTRSLAKLVMYFRIADLAALLYSCPMKLKEAVSH